MNNKEHQELRQRLNRLDPWMVFKAITGKECPRTGDVGETPYDDAEPNGALWRIDAVHRTIKCSEQGLGGNIIQFVMDMSHKSETDAERFLVEAWEEMLTKSLNEARQKRPDCDDIWSGKIIDLSKYDGEPDDTPAPYYERDTMYRRQLMADVLHLLQRNYWKNEEARQFAASRGWSDAMARDWDLGYDDWHTIDAAVDEYGWSRTELYKLGFLNQGEKGDLDRMHGRIIMPAYDRFGSVVGYTSRILKSEEERQRAKGIEPSKYMSAPTDGWLEAKSRILYGMNRATQSIIKAPGNKVYMAEGNPDIMRLHSIGIDNAVAPMGTGLNDDTWHALIKARVQTICFIPDIDVPKDGDKYGVGIMTAMKNGKWAIKQGFSVQVKELPIPKTRVEVSIDPDTQKEIRHTVENVNDSKVDCDDWFNPLKTWSQVATFEQIKEQSFILWYAAKTLSMMSEQPTPEERNAWTLDIAEMIICLDETLRDDYIRDLIAMYKAVNKAKWTEAIKLKIGKRNQERIAKSQRSQGNLQDYGLQEVGGCYYLEGSEEPFTNFVVEPHYFIEKWGDSHWICRAISSTDRIRVVDYDNDILTSPQKFKSRMASLAMFAKIGKSGAELDNLFQYISDNSQEVKKVDRLGWQPNLGVWCWGNGVSVPSDKTFYQSNDYGVSDFGNEVQVYIPSSAKISGMDEDGSDDGYEWERALKYEEKQSWPLNQVLEQIIKVYGENGKVAIMFLVASIFRDVVNKYSQGFPILCGYGPRGSGKSSIGKTLTSFFSTSSGMMVTLGENTTDSSLDLLLGHGQNVVVQLDEYKNTIRESQISIIKAIWDSEGRSVRNMNSKNKSSSKTKVRCGVVVTGQEIPNVEAAMFTRFLPCEFYDDKEAQKRNTDEYNKLKAWEGKGFSYLTRQILECRQEFEDDFQQCWEETVDDMDKLLEVNKIQAMVRIKNNWCAVLAAMRTLSRHEWWPFTYWEARKLVFERIDIQNKMNEQSDERADFWKSFALCVGSLRIRKGAHYKIKNAHYLNVPTESTKMADDKKRSILRTVDVAKRKCERVLLIRYDDVYPIIRAFAKSTGDDSKLMDSGSMRNYINKEAEGYIGETPLETFADCDKDGRPVFGYDSQGKPKVLVNRKAGVMVFNYDLIAERYEIDLDAVPSISDKDDSQE